MTLEWIKTIALIAWPLVILVAIVLFRKPLLASFKDLSWQDVKRAKVGSGGIEIERAEKIEKRQDRQEQEINAIKIALKGILTKHESGPLKGLNEAAFMMRWEPDLYRYLHRLDGLDFIQPNKWVGGGLYTIEKDHKNEDSTPYDQRPQWDLRQYVYITENGKNYLKTLKDLGIE